jgi:hypothetical protein
VLSQAHDGHCALSASSDHSPLTPSVSRQLRFDHIRHQAMFVAQNLHHFE